MAKLEEVKAHWSNQTIAADLGHEARTTLEDIIEYIPEGELRASFEALPVDGPDPSAGSG